jgi:hypothetical protein
MLHFRQKNNDPMVTRENSHKGEVDSSYIQTSIEIQLRGMLHSTIRGPIAVFVHVGIGAVRQLMAGE